MSAVRKRTAELLQANRPDDPASRIVDLFLIVLIVSNILAAMFVTVPFVRSAGAGLFRVFEVFTVLIFTIEYLLRLWSVVEKKKYQGMSLKNWKECAKSWDWVRMRRTASTSMPAATG